ncbi:hypothetical protein AMK59_4540 [Oryctes borbonicus]|uniref:Uncharacterized protein n=1 Tax=Oryctes borbonicus TaxID=1629725 RepID=A0A0T6B827_9SCAR|nr:hypothetical protein AMK59_4540 [Oryctes borbonicus]
MYSFEQLDRETARLHQLLKMIQTNKYKADTVWNSFCMEMNKGNQKPQKKYFKKHPKTLSESSSEILSPRPKASCLIRKNLNTAKSANNIKFAEPTNNEDELTIETGSISSVEAVTIRQEYPLKRASKNKCANVSTMKSKDNTNRKRSKANKSSHDSIVNKKSSKELETTISGKVKEDVEKCNFEAKLQGIIEKSLNCMEDIRVQLDIGITPPDGLDDLERRKKRSSEFASRFSRNYLYQLNRQLSDLKKLLCPTSGRSSHQNSLLAKQKITSPYQTILQGLQAYLTHLPISTPMGVPDKIKELLKEVNTLCELQRSYTGIDINSNVKNNELLDIYEVRSRCLIEKIDDYYSTASVISLLQSQSKFSLLEQSKARKKSNIKSRYSMYTGMPTRKDAHWKRAAASLARKKYNVQSKYKTAYFKHRPPIEKQPVVKPVIKTKPIEKKSSTNIKIKPTIDDDNIKTLIEMEKEKTQKSAVKDPEIVGDNLVPLIEKLIDKLKEENKINLMTFWVML